MESGGAAILECWSGCKVSFLVEMVVDGAVNRGEFLQNSLRGPSVRIRRNRSIARSRRRNGWWEFSALLFFQRPTTRRS
jgi:hypothetical protein